MTTKEKLQIKQFYENYQFREAADYLSALLNTTDEDRIALYNLAYSHYCSADYSSSLRVMNTILKKSPISDYQIILLAARIYLKCHYYNRAEKLLLYIISESKTASEALALLCVYYFLVGDDNKSRIFYDRAKNSDSESPGFIVADARLSLYMKKKKKEGDALDMTLTHTTGEHHLAAIRALYYLQHKNKRAARKEVMAVNSNFPEDVRKAFICMGV